MKYLCAQPDDYYFTWQIDLLVHNFQQFGINKNDIHILIGHDQKVGLQNYFRDTIERNKNLASFYLYPDLRQSRRYKPSIRPHIISQHLAKFPDLSKESIFYHDCDIIFIRLPNFDDLLKDDIWYVSDTRDYLDSNYIRKNADESLFDEMCDVIGVNKEKVMMNDLNCGGAQYLIKSSTVSFWKKIERDSEALYSVMKTYNTNLYLKNYSRKKIVNGMLPKGKGIQAWCSDMWAIFWNAILENRQIKIHKELDFIISKSPIDDIKDKNILHYSGDATDAEGPIFRKIKYSLFPPFYDLSLNRLSKNTASFYLFNFLKDYREKLFEYRIDLKDVTFLIPVKIDSNSRLENLSSVISFLNKYFKTNIIIGEMDYNSKIEKHLIPECCEHIFIKDSSEFMHRTKLNNILIHKATTPLLAIYDTDVIFATAQIEEAVMVLRELAAEMVSPYDGRFKGVTNMFKSIFARVLDPLLFTMNLSCFSTASNRSFGGAIFFNKQAYLKAGLENEFFSSWGPEDIERVKRMKILGYRVKRIEGPLFHLPHERKENSGYQKIETYYNFIEEYIKICKMDKKTLEQYIDTWN